MIKTISLGIFYGVIIALTTALTLGVLGLTGFALGSVLNAFGLNLKMSYLDYMVYGLMLWFYSAAVYQSIKVLRDKWLSY